MSLVSFWYWLLIACLVWYSTITVYVSVRAVWDIRGMLARIHATGAPQEQPDVTDVE
ncbi:MAG: hypothetical protein WD845_01965 [Pirellulales bacterium]|jgi:hypothetical protein